MVKWERNLIGGTKNVHVWMTKKSFERLSGSFFRTSGGKIKSAGGITVSSSSPKGMVRVYPNVGGKKGFIVDLEINNEKYPRGLYQQKVFKTRAQANVFVKKYMKTKRLSKLKKVM